MDQRTYACNFLRQRESGSLVMAVFIARARDVLQWAGVRRVGEHELGMQRIRKRSRVNAIRRFMELDRNNSIPTSIVVAFGPGVAKLTELDNETIGGVIGADPTNGGARMGWGRLDFDFDPSSEEKDRPALIVDGQHRLHGLAALDEGVPILVTALIDASAVEQAFQFIVINNKATRVMVDNVKSIIAEFDEVELSERLKRARIDYRDTPGTLLELDTRDDSPFRGLIDWPSNQEGRRIVKPATIEACLRYISSVFPAFRDGDDDDTVREMFIAVWRAARACYSELFPASEKFMSKVSMTALNEYVFDRVDSAYQDGSVDIYDPDRVHRYAEKKIFRVIPAEFWKATWRKSLSDTATVRNEIKDALKRVAQNERASSDREWYDGVDLIVPDSVS